MLTPPTGYTGSHQRGGVTLFRIRKNKKAPYGDATHPEKVQRWITPREHLKKILKNKKRSSANILERYWNGYWNALKVLILLYFFLFCSSEPIK